MLKTILLIILLIVIIGSLALAWNYWRFSRSISQAVARLESNATTPAPAIITKEMLFELPEPAQRFFDHAGVIGQQIPRIIKLTQKGRIRSTPEASWMEFEAEETYSTSPPAFVWRVWFPTKSTPVALGRDIYTGGQSSILMKMLASFTLADEDDPELKAAGLMRYLNEVMWFPAAYLADNISIAPVDANSFSVEISDKEITARATIVVDAGGRFVNFIAHRFNTETAKIEEWHTPMTAYGTFEGLNLPVSGSAIWKLPEGDFTYIELEITGVTYAY